MAQKNTRLQWRVSQLPDDSVCKFDVPTPLAEITCGTVSGFNRPPPIIFLIFGKLLLFIGYIRYSLQGKKKTQHTKKNHFSWYSLHPLSRINVISPLNVIGNFVSLCNR
jgi:hypothetical protein